MADKLSAADLVAYSVRNLRLQIVRTATINNDAISATDISEYVTGWGELKTEVYNKHPDDRGVLRFPVLSVDVNNESGVFDSGGVLFPNGRSDYNSTTLNIVIAIAGTTRLDFTGNVRQPEYNSSKLVVLVAEHPLAATTQRKWKTSDRYGGYTGIRKSFNS